MKYFIIFFFIVCLAETHAQTRSKKEIDSLLSLLPKKEDDTSNFRLYYDLFSYYIENNADSALLLEMSALQRAEKLRWEYGINVVKQNIGRAYWRKGNFDLAIKYHSEALKYYQRINDTSNVAFVTVYIGQDYADGGKYPEALNYFSQAKVLYEQIGDIKQIAYIYFLFSFVYSSQGNYSESIKADYEALKIYEQLSEPYGSAIAKGNIADSYVRLGNYQEALRFYNECALAMLKNNDISNLVGNYISIGQVYSLMGNYSEAVKYLTTAYDKAKGISDEYRMADSQKSLGEVYLLQNNYREALTHYLAGVNLFRKISSSLALSVALCKSGVCQTKLGNYTEARKNFNEARALSDNLDSKISIAEYYHGVELLDSATGDWYNAYMNHSKYSLLMDSLNGMENTKKILQLQFQSDSEKKAVLEKAAQEKKDILQRTIRNSIAATLAGSLIFLVVVYRQRNKISKEKARSEELLLNILPNEVAEELKIKGSADAKQFDEVTVMFTDFKGFTQISERLTPSELVTEIHACFKVFDNIITKYNIEKIKTIGDSYMCAGGLPVINTTNATDVVNAALEIQKFMVEHILQRKKDNKEIFEVRIGIHTGPVVAGIVGVKKFAYDIWGDTVNIASRMESSGEAGKVNISGSTYEIVKDQFSCTYRGKIQAKNKGEIDMYFVEVVS